MIKKIVFVMAIISFSIFAQPKFEATNTAPGVFSRMGFLPRGIGMGNALSALPYGNVLPFYNPALSAFQADNAVQLGYTFLSLDRHLNFFSYGRRFEFYSSKDTVEPKKPRATAGISLGIINSGVTGIEERNGSGIKTGDISTSENLFFVALANKFSQRITVGFTVKVYYNHLYQDINATATGFDLGVLANISDNLKASLVLGDLNAKYKWDTSPVRQTDGAATTDLFPTFFRLGVSYRYFITDESPLLGCLEFESNSYGRKLVRAGAEYEVIPGLFARAGLDNFVLNNSDDLLLPSGGFSFSRQFDSYSLGIEYAIAPEAYAQGARQTIGLIFRF